MQIALTVDVGVERWSYFSLRARDPKFTDVAKTVWQRDHYTCRYCSFRAYHKLQVVNINGNYLDNRMTNLATACPLCSQCLFIEHAGRHDAGGGLMIYLPELSQNDLNGLCHALFCAIAMASHAQEHATRLYDSLKLRAQPIEKIWGKGLSQPNFLGQMLIDTPMKSPESMRRDILKDIRLLPSYEGFSSLLDLWISSSTSDRTQT